MHGPIVSTLTENPILTLFIVIGLGYVLGEISFFGFRLGIVGVAIMWIGANDILAGRMTIGAFVSYTLYLGLLGNQAQRPVTHSLSTVVVFAAAAAASRRHRAVLAGVATGLVLADARETAPGEYEFHICKR